MEMLSDYPVQSLRSATSIMPLEGLTGFKTLIRLGWLDPGEGVELAIRAVKKARRSTSSDIHLLITSNTRRPDIPGSSPIDLSVHTPVRMKAVLSYYRRVGRLLEPALNEQFGRVFLNALASGVPLDGMNYHQPAPEESWALIRSGDASLGIR